MRPNHDDLIRLAFGELSAEEARAVEVRAAADVASRSELEAFRDLRASLQHLPPPPPDGLSPERLRAAILERDLKSRQTVRFPWGWAPVAAVMAACALVMMKPTPRVPSEVVSFASFDGADVATLAKKMPANSPSTLAGMAVPSVDKSVVPPPVEKRSSGPRVALVSRRRPHRHVETPADSSSIVETPVEDTPVALVPTLSVAQVALMVKSEPQAIAAPSAVLDGDNGPLLDSTSRSRREDVNRDRIVLISNKRDAQTGAPAATETEAANVLVGG